MQRGDVYWADIASRSGSEQTAPSRVIIVSHDAFNQSPGWNSIIVVPLTNSGKQGIRGPTVVELKPAVSALAKPGFVVCHQITTLDRSKLTKRVGALSPALMIEVEAGGKVAMDLQ